MSFRGRAAASAERTFPPLHNVVVRPSKRATHREFESHTVNVRQCDVKSEGFEWESREQRFGC